MSSREYWHAAKEWKKASIPSRSLLIRQGKGQLAEGRTYFFCTHPPPLPCLLSFNFSIVLRLVVVYCVAFFAAKQRNSIHPIHIQIHIHPGNEELHKKMSSDSEIPLLERAELPEFMEIPKEARQPLTVLEHEFVNAEVELMRQAIPIMRPLYARRNELISTKLKEADFWPRVFSNSPAEIDEYIRPSDAQIIGAALKNMTIERIGVSEKGEGEPRDMRFVFEFDESENEWFEGSKLVKEFYWRKQLVKSPSGKPKIWEGLVSDPVRIQWKKDMDVTGGLLDAACDLFDAEKAFLKKEGKQKLTAEERMRLPEFEKLVQKTAQIEQEVENEGEGDDDEGESSPAGVSFFAWFGFRGRDITEAESKEAAKEEPQIWEKIKSGEEEAEADEDDEDEDGLAEAEIFQDGEGLTLSIGEDLWPNALKYFTQSYHVGDDLEFDFGDLGDVGEEEGEGDEEEEERPRKKART